jgi:serine/threonine protein phosphatase 1
MLDARTDYETQHHWRRNLGGNFSLNSFIYKHNRAEQNAIYKYLEASPLELHIEVEGRGRFHLIHGRPSQEDKEKLWGRFEKETGLSLAMFSFGADERVICGHTPTIHYSKEQPMSIYFGSGFIDIDCGCAHQKAPGRLGCLRLNDMREFYCDIPTVIPKEGAD